MSYPQPYNPMTPPQKKTSPILIALVVLGVVVVVGFVALAAIGAIIGPSSSPSASASPSRAAAGPVAPSPHVQTPIAAAKPAKVTVPNVVGKNGAVAYDKLTKLGMTNIQFGSADPSASVVLLFANWHVTKQEPKAGAKVGRDSLVVLTAVKNSG